ncbi:heat shock factor protein 3-like isoform X1 [Pantherophis guttatus]|uniref:Heat shock factor protein 3-like isoform X1 n=1 Tax=Pantherophis guttatus TaxID=94885 RepID=A0A6P9D5Z6_PANGU|nr:heat shock factor protein 3-like isoform X1 [Pantherophis guttatus]
MKKAVALVGAGPPSPGASSVPGFLAKLWSLVEDPGSDDVISWSRNGQNFCILDEQRFAKELLPKYFKHNNLSSFIRQLNIYGFRKVMALENGMITSEKNPAIEFQHPFFKRGKIDLLANIKRKSTLTQVATVRPEDLKICPDDLHKVLSEVQEMREQQNSMDIKLESMKRENKALWKEVAFLRQKHNQQQQLLSKILEFILGLMRGNCILGVKRKRSLADASDPSAPKFSRQYVRIPVEDCETTALSEHGPDCQDSIIICDITDAQEEEEEEDDAAPEKFLALVHSNHESWKAPVPTREGIPTCKTIETSEPEVPQGDHSVQLLDGSLQSSAVELHIPQVNANEEAAAVIDSIINENQTTASSDSFLEREEIQDFLNCIDASLEELQAMLSGEKTNHASETLTDTFSPELPVLDSSIPEAPLRLEKTEDLSANLDTDGIMDEETSGKNDMQLIQYRGNPLLSLLEEPPSSEEDGRLGNTGGDPLGSMESNKAVQQVTSPGSQTAGAAPLEPLDQPLLSEDMNGEYKLFPLLLLSPVANFIEEASEIETS